MTRMKPIHDDGGSVGDGEAGPLLYTFDCHRRDGSPICLEVYELMSDEHVLARARGLLGEHLTCWSIEVFEGERRVGVVTRNAARGEAHAATGT